MNFFLGDGACLPTESATKSSIVADDDMKGACSSSKPVEVKIVLPKKRVSNDDVLRMQYECLSCQKENLLLKKQKLQLQIQLLEQQVNASYASALNADFVAAE